MSYVNQLHGDDYDDDDDNDDEEEEEEEEEEEINNDGMLAEVIKMKQTWQL